MRLKQFHGKARTLIDADPDRVFATLTDTSRLPLWNRRIAAIVRPPTRPLAEGVEWKVQMTVPPARWVSRTRVLVYDPQQRRVRHRSQSDDDNPSYVDWTWTVTPVDGASRVQVEWDAHVKTFWRQLIFAKRRRSQLADEVPASLGALAYHVSDRETR
jgi:uncharacterized protein YndB with AHSA1/START domain